MGLNPGSQRIRPTYDGQKLFSFKTTTLASDGARFSLT